MLVLLTACAAPESIQVSWFTETLPACDDQGYTYWTPPDSGDVVSLTVQRFTTEADIYHDSQSVSAIGGTARIYCGADDVTRVTYAVRVEED